MKSFIVYNYPLTSFPNDIGYLADYNLVYVSQEHPEGRITFIDPVDKTSRTLTGFELNSRIR